MDRFEISNNYNRPYHNTTVSNKFLTAESLQSARELVSRQEYIHKLKIHGIKMLCGPAIVNCDKNLLKNSKTSLLQKRLTNTNKYREKLHSLEVHKKIKDNLNASEVQLKIYGTAFKVLNKNNNEITDMIINLTSEYPRESLEKNINMICDLKKIEDLQNVYLNCNIHINNINKIIKNTKKFPIEALKRISSYLCLDKQLICYGYEKIRSIEKNFLPFNRLYVFNEEENNITNNIIHYECIIKNSNAYKYMKEDFFKRAVDNSISHIQDYCMIEVCKGDVIVSKDKMFQIKATRMPVTSGLLCLYSVIGSVITSENFTKILFQNDKSSETILKELYLRFCKEYMSMPLSVVNNHIVREHAIFIKFINYMEAYSWMLEKYGYPSEKILDNFISSIFELISPSNMQAEDMQYSYKKCLSILSNFIKEFFLSNNLLALSRIRQRFANKQDKEEVVIISKRRKIKDRLHNRTIIARNRATNKKLQQEFATSNDDFFYDKIKQLSHKIGSPILKKKNTNIMYNDMDKLYSIFKRYLNKINSNQAQLFLQQRINDIVDLKERSIYSRDLNYKLKCDALQLNCNAEDQLWKNELLAYYNSNNLKSYIDFHYLIAKALLATFNILNSAPVDNNLLRKPYDYNYICNFLSQVMYLKSKEENKELRILIENFKYTQITNHFFGCEQKNLNIATNYLHDFFHKIVNREYCRYSKNFTLYIIKNIIFS